jgi:hypothetical protein
MALPNHDAEWQARIDKLLANIEIPPDEPVTEEEIARRRALYDEAMALRVEMKPLGMTTAELIHQVRGLAWDEEEDQHGPS